MKRVAVAAFSILLALPSWGQVVLTTPSNPWDTVDAGFLSSPDTPGSNYAPFFLPSSGTYSVSINGGSGGVPNKWNFQVRFRAGFNLPAGVTEVAIRRTGNGTGSGGGASIGPDLGWIVITSAYQTLFTGRKIRSNVPLLLRVTMDANAFTGPVSPAALMTARLEFIANYPTVPLNGEGRKWRRLWIM